MNQIASQTVVQTVKLVAKESQTNAIILSQRERALKRINDMQAELGRMTRLLDEMRADLLHLTVE
jgi:hypothetical protein